jgi:hypothetical protein
VTGFVPSLAWVPLFAASANRALDGDLLDTQIVQRTDPLQWVLSLTAATTWTAATSTFMRQLLEGWCSSNNAELASAGIGNPRTRWTALILIRGLGPEMKVNPYEEDSDAARNARRRLHLRPKVRR